MEDGVSVSAKTRKMLWGRAASRCSLPTCRIPLVEDISETDDPSLIGEECHIVAKEEHGPREKSTLTVEQRDKYSNLILMCCNHHKVIDDNEDTYPIQALLEMKSLHEKWIRESLTDFDPSKQQDDELYAGYIDEWEQRLDIQTWDSWTYGLMTSGESRTSTQRMKKLSESALWLFSRIWPRRYLALEAAFENFRRVLQDLVKMFHKHGEVDEERGRIWIDKIYKKLNRYDEKEYNKLLALYNYNVELVYDLMLELTRAANLICTLVRMHINRHYRLAEGLIVVTAGPFINMDTCEYGSKVYRPQYRPGTKPDSAYEGLDEFKKQRYRRDVYLSADEPPQEEDTDASK